MKLYLLDWKGTLDTLGGIEEIRAFLDALTSRGDLTMGCSGGLPDYAQEANRERKLFTFGNLPDLKNVWECLSIGEKAARWESFDEGKTWYAASRLMDPRSDYQQEFDPSCVEEIVWCDDSPCNASPQYMALLGERMGRPPIRFIYPEDLPKELA